MGQQKEMAWGQLRVMVLDQQMEMALGQLRVKVSDQQTAMELVLQMEWA